MFFFPMHRIAAWGFLAPRMSVSNVMACLCLVCAAQSSFLFLRHSIDRAVIVPQDWPWDQMGPNSSRTRANDQTSTFEIGKVAQIEAQLAEAKLDVKIVSPFRRSRRRNIMSEIEG
jgi:hypothetical protein